MGNKVPDNFKNTVIRDHDTAVRLGRAGGLASGEAKRRNKAMRESLEILLSMPLTKGKLKELEDIRNLESVAGKNVRTGDAIATGLVQKALSGDTNAINLIVELLGEKLQRIEFSKIIDDSSREMEAYFAAREAEEDAKQD